MSDESIKAPTRSDNNLAPALNYIGNKVRVKFAGSCLKHDKITYTHGKIVNICIVYEINLWNHTYSSDPTVRNCLFGAVKLVKKMLILINISVLDMVLDWIRKELLNFPLLDSVEML